MGFGERLKKIRLEKGLSQEELATLLKTSKQVISRYENNQRTPRIDVASEYAAALGVPLDYLLGAVDVDAANNAPNTNVGFNDFTYAMHNETKELTEENKQKLLEMARFFREQQEKQKEK